MGKAVREKGRNSKSKQAIEERTIAPQCLSQIFGRDVVSTVPLMFQFSPLRGKRLRNAFQDGGNQAVALLHRRTRLVHKADLRLVPPSTKLVEFVVGEELSGPIVLKLLIRHDIASSFDGSSVGDLTCCFTIAIRLDITPLVDDFGSGRGTRVLILRSRCCRICDLCGGQFWFISNFADHATSLWATPDLPSSSSNRERKCTIAFRRSSVLAWPLP